MHDLESKVSVAIVEDHEEISSSLELLINNSKSFRCVATFPNLASSLSKLKDIYPDIVLTDINLPDGTGIDLVRKLKPEMSLTEFVILTMYDDNELVFEALKAGATGYLLKRTPPSKIIDALFEVSQGGSPMSLEIARKVVNNFKIPSPSEMVQEQLTEREWEILGHLSKGLRYKEIAKELQISIETVRSHLRKVYEKLQVRSATEAVLKYLDKRQIK